MFFVSLGVNSGTRNRKKTRARLYFGEQGARFFVFVRSAQEYQNQMKICGSRRCRATLTGMRPSRICFSVSLVGQATSAPHTEEARPKEPTVFNNQSGPFFRWCLLGKQFVSKPLTTPAAFLVYLTVHAGRARGAH